MLQEHTYSREKLRSLLGITYHRDLQTRYEEVRDNPWLAVPPDISTNNFVPSEE